MSSFSHTKKLAILADNLEHKYASIKKTAIYGGHGSSFSSPGYASGVGSQLGTETEFTKINDFVLKTIPEFELFLKNIVPALKEMKRQYVKAIKESKTRSNNLKDLAEINNISWDWGQEIPEELQTVMLSSLMMIDPVGNYFTKIASLDVRSAIAFKLALANRSLSFFDRMKDKAKSFFGKKSPVESESESVYSPGLDISLERKKTFELKDLLKDIMPYVYSFIDQYKDFYNTPTLSKLDNLLYDSQKFNELLAPIKSEVKQLQEFVTPSMETAEELFFEGESLSDKSSMGSLLSYIMRDPDLSNPLNVKRALKLHRMLGEKLRNIGAL